MSDEDILAGPESEIPIGDLDENVLLGDDLDVIKKEPDSDTNVDDNDDGGGDGDDLYDAAIEPSGQIEKKESVDNSNSVASQPLVAHSTSSNTSLSTYNTNRRYQCYIGNMTWWTTDDDIIKCLEGYGIKDVIEIKFGENRQNGQSRGFASVATYSEQSIRTVMDRLPGRQIHGQLVVVLPFNKQSLAKLEEATKRMDPVEKKEEKPNMMNIGTVRIGPPQGMNMGNMSNMGMMNRPQMPVMNMNGVNNGAAMLNLGFGGNNAPQIPNILQMRPTGSIQPLMQQRPINMARPPPQIANPILSQAMNRPPPNFVPNMGNGMAVVSQPHSNVNTAQVLNNAFRNQQNTMNPQPVQALIPPGTHVNPQVYPYFAHNQQPDTAHAELSSADYKEIMNRNRTVSSSAIARALSDAAAGDVASAVDTLVIAMSLIKQSRVANDEGCKTLLDTLQDALNSVESKGHSSRKHRRRSRSPSERSSRKHHRKASRSRSRDRYDYSPRHSSRRY